jgi:hypothetical protein
MSSVIGGEGTARRLCTCGCALCTTVASARHGARRVRQATSEGDETRMMAPRIIGVSPSVAAVWWGGGAGAACGGVV